MPELYDSRTMKGGRVFLRIRVGESEGLRLAARTSAHTHIAGVRDDVAPRGYFVCDTVELLQADGTAAAISILTDFLRTDVYLWLASIERVPAGILTPRMMTHEDDHFPLRPLNEHERLFQVMGLSLDTLESWDGDTICLETDKKLADLLKPPPQQETVKDRIFTDRLDKGQAIRTVEEELSSPREGEEERVGEGTIPKSEDSSGDHGGVITKGSLGRGENAMRVVNAPRRPVDCILVKDDTPESDEAERLLREAGIHFSADPPGFWGKRKLELQTVEYGNIRGLQGVKAFISTRSLRRAV